MLLADPLLTGHVPASADLDLRRLTLWSRVTFVLSRSAAHSEGCCGILEVWPASALKWESSYTKEIITTTQLKLMF